MPTQVEATAQAREAAMVAEQEVRLEAAKSREHDALELAEAQWRHAHHGEMTCKEQQARMAWAWRGRGVGMAWAWRGRGVCMAWAWRVRGECVACAWHGVYKE